MKIAYYIGDDAISLQLDGEVFVGEDAVLLDKDRNLIAGTPWANIGFTVAAFLTPEQFIRVKQGIRHILAGLIERVGAKVDERFTLEHYHRYVTDEQHIQIARLIQYGWNVSEFPVDFQLVENRISEILGLPVSAEAKHADAKDYKTGLTDKVYDKMQVFNLRIARPGKMQDNNPPHRDVWLDRLRNAVNIYAPFSGSTPKSALAVLPGSHYLKESEIERTSAGATLNGTKYSVPCVTKVLGQVPKLLRATPTENEVMVFSPYMVHGGGYNLETDVTRISLEVRFWHWA